MPCPTVTSRKHLNIADSDNDGLGVVTNTPATHGLLPHISRLPLSIPATGTADKASRRGTDFRGGKPSISGGGRCLVQGNHTDPHLRNGHSLPLSRAWEGVFRASLLINVAGAVVVVKCH